MSLWDGGLQSLLSVWPGCVEAADNYTVWARSVLLTELLMSPSTEHPVPCDPEVSLEKVAATPPRKGAGGGCSPGPHGSVFPWLPKRLPPRIPPLFLPPGSS